MSIIRKGVAISAVAATVAAVGPVAASASVQWTNDKFDIATPFLLDVVNGGIVWGNRTAEIQGRVGRAVGSEPGFTAVYFDAFAGSTLVASTFRRTPNTSGHTDLHFDIGDPLRPGGVNRIRIVLCNNKPDGTHASCTPQYNEIRN